MAGEPPWDPQKRVRNLERHHIDFEDAVRIFEHKHLLLRSDRGNEERWMALGRMSDVIVVVVFTWRDGVRRLISARPAHRHERKIYVARFGQDTHGRQD